MYVFATVVVAVALDVFSIGNLWFCGPQFKGAGTPMFRLITYLPCFDPCVLFCCLVFCSVSSSTDVHN